MSSQTTPDDRAAATRGFAPIPRRYEEPRAGPAFEVLGMIAGGVFGLTVGTCLALFLGLATWLLLLAATAAFGGTIHGVVGNVFAPAGSIVAMSVAFEDQRRRALLCRAGAGRLTISEVTLRVSQIPLALAVVVELGWIVWWFIR